MLTIVKIAKEFDNELMQDTPITSSKLLEKLKEFKPYQRPRNAKISSMEMVKNEVARILKKNTLFVACCNF